MIMLVSSSCFCEQILNPKQNETFFAYFRNFTYHQPLCKQNIRLLSAVHHKYPQNSVIVEWWVNAVMFLMKLYAFTDGFNVNIYITLSGKI